MKVHSRMRPSFAVGCCIGNVLGHVPRWSTAVASVIVIVMYSSTTFAGGPVKMPAPDGASQQPPQSYAPIGESGYRVPIPEIRMNRIFGVRPVQRPPKEEPAHDAVQPGNEPHPTPVEKTHGDAESPKIDWLPFDPMRRSPSLRPHPQRVAPKESAPEAEPVIRPPVAPEQPLEAVPPTKEILTKPPVLRIPVLIGGSRSKDVPGIRHSQFRQADEGDRLDHGIPLHSRRGPSVVSAPEPEPEPVEVARPDAKPEPVGIMAGSRSKESPSPKELGFRESGEQKSSVEGIPTKSRREPSLVAAPEPEPVEMARPDAKPEPVGIVAGSRSKESPSPKELGFREAGEQKRSVEGIPVDSRREPARVAVQEPEPKPEPKLEPKLEPKPEPAVIASPEPKPESKSEPVRIARADPRSGLLSQPSPEPTADPMEVPKETGTEHSQEPVEMKPPAGEVEPAEEQPVSPAKEAVPSPLDPDASPSAEVRRYLQAAAPILEELSLLMTRAPSLAVADYDPSQNLPNAFRDDVYMKIEFMKRELQILDSKTFAIIPPRKYTEFHAVIRESITETYQACDTIVSYMRDPSERNLLALQEHLRRARDLIQKTRTGSS